jgi:hypothetical protein
MDCHCEIGADCSDYAPELYREKKIIARKEHLCCECGELIKKGERYELAEGKWEGEWSSYRTCVSCSRIRDDLTCGEFIFGELRERIKEYFGFDYVKGED